MIEINLLPRAGKKARSRSAAGSGGAFAALSGLRGRIRDPYLTGAMVSLVAAAAVIGFMHLQHMNQVTELTEIEQEAVQDSTRYAAILKEKYAAEAQRDSILQQLEIIRSIDNDRFVWPHLMEEVSRALPAYTWMVSMHQTSEVVSRAARPDSAAPGTPAGAAAQAAAAAQPQPLTFRMVGQTVDIQALTRFVKLLESSPFIQNVHIARADVTDVRGTQVHQFELDAQYEVPPPSAIRTVPVTLTVR